MPGRGTALDVLIVDDFRDMAEAIRRWLEANGYTAAAAYTVAEAMPFLQLQPRFIFADVFMGLECGAEVIKAAKQADPTCKGWLITAANDTPVVGLADDCGAEGTIWKPLDGDELVKLIQSFPAETKPA